MANDMNLGEILENAVKAAIGEHYSTTAREATLVPDEYERMAFLRDPQEAYANCTRQIGSGCYGAARETASGSIIKRFAMKDGYGMWLSFCMLAYHRGTGNAQLPRAFAMSIPDDETTSPYGYALMEKLTKDVDGWMDTKDGRKRRETATLEFRNGMSELVNRVNYGHPLAGHLHTPIERLWAEFLLMAKTRGMTIGGDMHMGNVLFRNHGEKNEVTVVTDPAVLMDGSVHQARKFMYDTLNMVSAYKLAMWSEMRSRQIIEATVQ